VRQAAPRHRTPLPALTPEYLAGLLIFARRYFEQLYRRLKPPAVIVLDYYQEVPAESKLHEVLRDACETLPAGIRIVVVSRADPPAAYARLRAHGALEILGWEDLRLLPEESIEIAALRKSRRAENLSDITVRRLHDAVDGWAAGLVLLLEQGAPSGALDAGGHSREVLFDYFAGEIFDRADALSQALLLKTAFLPKKTASMAERLSGEPRAAVLLEDLHRKNYFTLKHAGPEPVYEYHPLFRAFLLARARRDWDPDSLREVQKQAAAILEEAGQIDAAAALYQAAGDPAGLSRLILGQAPQLLARGCYQTLAQWLAGLPGETVAENAWLLYWMGASCVSFDQAKARGYFERAFDLFEGQDNPTGIYLSWAAAVETFYIEWHDFTPLDQWITAFERVHARHHDYPSAEIELRVYALLIGIIWRQPQHRELARWAERSQSLLQSCTEARDGMPLGVGLLHYYIWKGDPISAGWVVDTLRRVALAPMLAPLAFTLWCGAAAGYYWIKGEHQACLDLVAEGLEVANSTGVHACDHWLFAQAVYGSLGVGDVKAAEGFLHKLWTAMRSRDYLLGSHYHFLSALLSWQRGDFVEALEHARRGLAMAGDAGAPVPAALCHLATALVLSERDEEAESADHIQKARAIGQAMGNNTLIERQCLLIEARTALRQEQEPRGLDLLGKALVLSRGMIGWSGCGWGPAETARLCVKALEAGIEVEQLQGLIRRQRLTPPDPATAPESWPWPVRVYTLGRFAVFKDGEPLAFGGKVQKKPLALLQALIAHGGGEVPEGQIADALWPDADGDAAYRSLITTLQRLRQLLGHPEAVVLSGGQLSLDPGRVWVDTWAFERLLGETEESGKAGTAAANTLREKALALYRGPFLAQVDCAWTVARRERLRAKFIHHLVGHGQRLEANGKWETAIACYHRGIESDDSVQAFYPHLIRCYRQLGREAEAEAELAAQRHSKVPAAAGLAEPRYTARPAVLKDQHIKPLYGREIGVGVK
jgi:DNA-binding SARP family transcriptional activator